MTTTPQPVQEPAGAVEAVMALADAYAEAAQHGEDAMSIARKCAALRAALASLQPVTQAKADVSIPGPGMNASGERVDSANVTQAKSEAVAWCQLTQSGTIAYFDGKPMVMPGPVGNDCHPHPLYAAPQEAVERPDGAGYFKRDTKGRWAQVNPADWILPGVVPLFLQPKIESAPAPQKAVERQPLTGWQPIETAPKNGRRVLVFDSSNNGGCAVAHTSQYPGRALEWINPGCHKLRPTHWQPLPEPPGIGPATQEKQHG